MTQEVRKIYYEWDIESYKDSDMKDLALSIQNAISTEELRDLIDELADLYEETDEMIERGVKLWPDCLK